jgi:protein SCO1
VADFIFTRCSDICPAMTSAMAGLQEQAPPGLRFVSLTVDPAYDTPEVLARYAKLHHAKAGWVFATGAASEVYRLAGAGFHMAAMAGDATVEGEGAFVHNAKFALVDSEGVVRGYYDSDDPASRRRLLRDSALIGPVGAAPRTDAALNACSAALLIMGFVLARRRHFADHRNCMLTALVSSTLFLGSYLNYHVHVGSIRYPGIGAARSVYLAILGTHTALALLVVPLVIATLVPALRQRFDRHRRLASLTLPVWTYVSLTGVVVYWMLYRV